MPTLRFTQFGGMMPRTSARLLPDMAAQSACNVKLQSGNLRPVSEPGLVTLPTKTMPPLSIFRARSGLTDYGWLTWPTDVDAVRGPFDTSVEARFYWSGEYEPKMGTYTNVTNGGGNDYPSAYWMLGFPNPQTAPTVTPSGGTSGNVNRLYCTTFFSVNGEETGPSPSSALTTGRIDGTWAIAAIDEIPVNTRTGTAAVASSVTTFTNAAAAKHWLKVGDRVKLYDGGAVLLGTAAVSERTSASVFKVPGSFATAVTWERETNFNTSGMKRRLYRSAGTNATFQLVTEDTAGTTYNDTLTDAQIPGDELISATWAPPPYNLTALAVHPSGALVGLAGNLVCFSEPYQPHAWPTEYQYGMDFTGIGLAVFGTEVAVGTLGNPYLFSGIEPASMSPSKLEGTYPCLSKRGVVSVGNGGLYPSKHGLILIGQGGPQVFTQSFFTADEWKNYNPATMVLAVANGRIYASYEADNGVRSMFVLDGPWMIGLDVEADELYADPSDGELYIGTDAGISLYDDSDEVPLNGSWKSKAVVLPTPTNFGAAKVEFKGAIDPSIEAAIIAAQAAATATNTALIATGNIHGGLGEHGFGAMLFGGSDLVDVPNLPASNSITFNLYDEDSLLFTKTLASNRAFRLPAGFKQDVVAVEVLSQCEVKEIRIAETMEALRQV